MLFTRNVLHAGSGGIPMLPLEEQMGCGAKHFSRGIKHSIADEVGGGIDCCLISEFYAHMLTEHGDLIYLSDCE